MNNKSVSIPISMLTHSFICHQCGYKLQRKARKRIVRRGDSDFLKHAVQRTGKTIIFLAGDVEITEYDFYCPYCHTTIRFDDQLVIEYIQKKIGNCILANSEIRTHEAEGKYSVKRRKLLSRILWWVLMLALTAVIIFGRS